MWPLEAVYGVKIRKRLIISLYCIFYVCRAYNMFRHHHITFVWNAFRVFTNYQRCNAFYLVSIIITATVDIKIQNAIDDEAECFRYELEVYFGEVELKDWRVIWRRKLKLLFRKRSCVLSLWIEIVDRICGLWEIVRLKLSVRNSCWRWRNEKFGNWITENECGGLQDRLQNYRFVILLLYFPTYSES